MKNWYITRDLSNLQHKSQPIPDGKRIFLTEAQAALHKDAIEPSSAPTSAEEAGVKAEYEEWQQTQEDAVKNKPKEEVKSKK